jgi:aminoglycoside phosphotransferase (APT) family kinase protein
MAILDWERAHRGDPEEDLGNLAAHLYWALEEGGRPAWDAVRCGYVAAGGELDPGLFAFHARLTLLRVLAIHSWRDLDRDRCLDRDRWERVLEECGRC